MFPLLKFFKRLRRAPPKYVTIKVRSGRFSAVRRRPQESDLSNIWNRISLLLACLCIFEAGVWFTSGFPEEANTNLRRAYLESRISGHNIYWSCPAIDPACLCRLAALVCVVKKLLSDSFFLHRKQQLSETPVLLASIRDRQGLAQWAVLLFLLFLTCSPTQKRRPAL